MAQEILEKDIWVLSPYCFCQDRHWLSIDDLYHSEAGSDGGGGVMATTGLARGDTALLAALLTALALFLFLLLLLLCCLYPWGVCGRGNRKKSQDIKSETSSDRVNLTAVDMKIPRAWTDSLDGNSFSQTGKYKYDKEWDSMADVEEVNWKNGYGKTGCFVNESSRKQDFQEGWFSTSDLDSLHGGMASSLKDGKSHTLMADTGHVYRGNLRSSSSQISRSMNHLDSILSYGNNSKRSHGNMVNTDYTYGSGDDDKGSLVEALTLTRTKALIRPVAKLDGVVHDDNKMLESSRMDAEFPSLTALEPYRRSYEDQQDKTASQSGLINQRHSTMPSPDWSVNNANDVMSSGTSGDVIQYTSTVRRTVEETTTST